MARICVICGKRRSVGHNVSHANNRTKRLWRPNLQRVKIKLEGRVRRLRVCAQCLLSGRAQKAV